MSNIKDITPDNAFKLIQENKENSNFVILDVRTTKEYTEGHIEDCVLIDFQQPDFTKKVQELDKNNTYLVYCRSGVRSLNASKMMINLGFTNLNNMKGGIMAWKACNLPVK